MAGRVLCVVAFIAVMSQFGKTIFGMVGLPNVLPLVRDASLGVLVVLAILRTDVFKSRGFFIAALLYLAVILANIVIAALESRHFAGLYYARLYLLPLASAVAVRGLIVQATPEQVGAMVRVVFWCGLGVILFAFGIFIAVQINPPLIYTMMGGFEGQQLATAWYIAGGTWLRMGLPATSPNALGLTLALYLLLVVSLMLDGHFLRLKAWAKAVVVLLGVMAVALSFSRSSWVALVLGGGVIFLLCRNDWGLGDAGSMLKVAGAVALVGVVLVAGLVAVDEYSDGYIARWFNLSKKGEDPSMVGHKQSFVDAIEAMPEYFWVGYPKGTVSARAALFGETQNVVENSIFGAFFEMGVPLGMAFLVLVGCLLRALWLHKSQWGMLAGFTFCSMLLPYVFEPDIIGMFMVLSVLMGRALQLSQEARLRGQAVPDRLDEPVESRRATGRGLAAHRRAFQATTFDSR